MRSCGSATSCLTGGGSFPPRTGDARQAGRGRLFGPVPRRATSSTTSVRGLPRSRARSVGRSRIVRPQRAGGFESSRRPTIGRPHRLAPKPQGEGRRSKPDPLRGAGRPWRSRRVPPRGRAKGGSRPARAAEPSGPASRPPTRRPRERGAGARTLTNPLDIEPQPDVDRRSALPLARRALVPRIRHLPDTWCTPISGSPAHATSGPGQRVSTWVFGWAYGTHLGAHLGCRCLRRDLGADQLHGLAPHARRRDLGS